MRAIVLVGLVAIGWGFFATPVVAADAPMSRIARPSGAPVYVLPFVRSERAQAVWEGGACWSECGSQCAWGQSACLRVDTQGRCLTLTDSCDRYCQRACRTSGGPLLGPLLNIFD